MRRALIIPLLLSAAACTDRVKDAEDRLAIIKKTGDKDAICREARKVADAYLDRKDEHGFEFAKLDADLACQDADLSRGR